MSSTRASRCTISSPTARWWRCATCGASAADGWSSTTSRAARVLDRLGVLKAVDAGGAAALAGMRITAPDGTVLDARYGAVGAFRPYRDHAMGVSRAALDGALLERVRALPVDLREGVRVTDVIVEHGCVVGVRAAEVTGAVVAVRARVVIAADGRASVIAHRLR